MCAAGPPHPGPLVAPLPVKKRTPKEITRLDPFDDRPIPKDIILAGQRRDAIRLHKAGKTYDEVGEALGLSETAAKKVVRDAVRLLTAELAENTLEEHKAVALAQLNDLYYVAACEREMYCTEVKQYRESEGREGKVPAWAVLQDIQDHLLRIHGAKTKLLGLNAATKVEASGTALVGLADLQQIHDAILANEAPIAVSADVLVLPEAP